MATLRYIEGSAKIKCLPSYSGFDILQGDTSNVKEIGFVKNSYFNSTSLLLEVSFRNDDTGNTLTESTALTTMSSGLTYPSGVSHITGSGWTITESGNISISCKAKEILEYEWELDDVASFDIVDGDVNLTLKVTVVENAGIPELKPYYVVNNHNEILGLLPEGCTSTQAVTFVWSAKAINGKKYMWPVCKEIEITKGSSRAKTYIFNTAKDYNDAGNENTFVRGSWGNVKGVDDPWFICSSSINNEVTLLTMPSSVLGSSVKSMTDVVTATASNASGKLKISIKRD